MNNWHLAHGNQYEREKAIKYNYDHTSAGSSFYSASNQWGNVGRSQVISFIDLHLEANNNDSTFEIYPMLHVRDALLNDYMMLLCLSLSSSG